MHTRSGHHLCQRARSRSRPSRPRCHRRAQFVQDRPGRLFGGQRVLAQPLHPVTVGVYAEVPQLRKQFVVAQGFGGRA